MNGRYVRISGFACTAIATETGLTAVSRVNVLGWPRRKGESRPWPGWGARGHRVQVRAWGPGPVVRGRGRWRVVVQGAWSQTATRGPCGNGCGGGECCGCSRGGTGGRYWQVEGHRGAGIRNARRGGSEVRGRSLRSGNAGTLRQSAREHHARRPAQRGPEEALRHRSAMIQEMPLSSRFSGTPLDRGYVATLASDLREQSSAGAIAQAYSGSNSKNSHSCLTTIARVKELK